MANEALRHIGVIPQGFMWGAVKAGIKASGNLDVAMAVAPNGANAAAMFTRNLVVAAPVTVGRKHLTATGGRVKAVLVNAGNANCPSGEAGVRACLETCRAAADAVGCIFDEVFPSSTGIIGVPLPAEKIVAAMPALLSAAGDSTAHAELFATAIMTTDTRMKVATAVIDAEGGQVRLFGAAKGAGMIHPQLGPPQATMLVYLFTDIEADAAALREMLEPAADLSFNSISIDGDTSTNDTVLLLASGASGVALNGETKPAFAEALRLVCGSLAHQIVDDGEGVTHVVTLEVTGAKTVEDARKVAKAIAHSPLNKTAWSSADPNWGRLIAAAGYSGVAFDPERLNVWIGDQLVFERGTRSALFDREAAHRTMSAREYTIRLALGEGDAECSFLTCDLTEEYVRINADYST
jgi:glutamate N-acetyltransferase/amino-acid N-acetyltransferase